MLSQLSFVFQYSLEKFRLHKEVNPFTGIEPETFTAHDDSCNDPFSLAGFL